MFVFPVRKLFIVLPTYNSGLTPWARSNYIYNVVGLKVALIFVGVTVQTGCGLWVLQVYVFIIKFVLQ